MIDIVVAITGLPKSDAIARYILNTFQTFQSFASTAPDETRQKGSANATEAVRDAEDGEKAGGRAATHHGRGMGLIYNINVVLPETTNIEVYNAIFRSLQANIL